MRTRKIETSGAFRQTRASWLAILALAASSSYACEPEQAEDVVRSYFLESLSPDCAEHRDKYSYDERWVESCKRMNFPPHKHLHAGFAERTTIKSVGTIERDSGTIGVIEYEGPDPSEFQLRLGQVGLCLDESDKADPSWPAPEWETSCGDEFWNDMPMKAQRGGVELVCADGDWRVYLPGPRTTKGISLEPDSAASAPRAEAPSPEQIKQQTALYAHVLSAQKFVEAVGRTCGQSTPRLAIAWNERNARALELANELRGNVQEQIEATAGSSAAKALEDRQDEYLAGKASQSIQEISALPDERKQRFCSAFLDSVESGRYDIVIPEPKKLVQTPLQEAAVTIDINASSKHLRYDLTYKESVLRDIEHVLFLPRGETIRFSVHSADVIHSLAFTDDQIKPMLAVPKLTNERNIVFEKLGSVGLGCLEGHPGSDEEVIAIDVVEQDEFDTWLRTIDAMQIR